MKTFVKQNTWLSGIDTGWGNGYVCIPKGHKLYGMGYDEIHDALPDLSVNGGLTFAEHANSILEWPELPEDCKDCWVVGFDTAHYNDSIVKWPNAESVMLEAKHLAEQLES